MSQITINADAFNWNPQRALRGSGGIQPPFSVTRAKISGFSLVELMVAMVIGMLGIVVMMQVFSVFEGQKRTTGSGDDAINSGAVSLYEIQRSIQQSGWGFSSVRLLGCDVTGLVAGAASIPLVPVTINSPLITGADANTDTLLVISGDGDGAGEGVNIESSPSTTSYHVLAPAAFNAGVSGPSAVPADLVVAVPQARPNPCSLNLTRVTAITTGDVAVVAPTIALNPITAGDRLFNLGRTPTVRAYAVRNGNLTVCDFTSNDCSQNTAALTAAQVDALWVPIATNVVSLRAEYGRDTTNTSPLPSPAVAMDGIVDQWDQVIATPTSVPPVSNYSSKNTQACGLVRVAAIRVALVARSSQPERLLDSGSHVTSQARAWTSLLWMGSDDAAHTIDATEASNVGISLPSPDPTWPTWQDFRYKVFQTVIPLRNITSQGAVSEC